MATSGEPDYRLQREQFFVRVKALMSAANENLRLAQARYKVDFDKALKLSTGDIRRGYDLF